ncbi:MAPEG family protein [Sulfitobacter pseudonitzschiae]|uniref:MAPEG family protein n=1 Tax=Pseudosulfitobacter pseudonitzschiae TaxID=1402135 RepID=A0A9Q2P1U1_9RHOB|nr:MAPEG family protein [Pseudosulfitobacter pseudonitzschiae]MBM2292398.1 MAPEG family protein [Pseudosulfitobacter pseudonitzschiae]MBM2297316.1 MAPEG family protein [Pseudosulfitobacter pseudonitzschiae]MBM2302230.1 MAPEG family protein [Pseudosulfitobacter pseudonitzschiae]MBM2312012.1 MAPEG family protein [Pseudosulfitobacter pseudonitzschiae]MBM2316926.1 MAPEG family protein [Pseudosulfitobacter pseudonitzschiae]
MDTFPTELGILAALALLAASLWIPYIIGVTRQGAAFEAFVRPGDLSSLPAWVHRAHRAHLNLLEQLLPFAILVLVLDRMGGFNALTYWTVVAFFWLRVAHAVGMISGLAKMPLRPILFVLGWVCCLVLASQVFLPA